MPTTKLEIKYIVALDQTHGDFLGHSCEVGGAESAGKLTQGRGIHAVVIGTL